ncbi:MULTISPECIES: RlmE family RNA methyltransferase [Candidatus Nitrosocaldus]|jgi:23S rRNA (uridine2552-2'-O)-methyltransferase|uniref:Ribosomal RNA large subunit methyltransferase E n=1 Tax=Candidatus Nitrosocaldus cavascurensis TaxID=2058097 RepID=A0A2K5AQM7_9ARCH|nr:MULTISPECIES: RlmE family RNA methyltransferase [Candidatus Nitrosocaldus]SPC33917.1 Ribosomal RNA large subunit methyltransferase E [Candidatus Nitrosocaldus cavascurensis]
MRLDEARRDYYRRLAKESGYKSRAAYKLLEINKSFHIFRKGDKVLDIGCYPGGWLQVASSAVGSDGLVLGVDVREMDVGKGKGKGKGEREEDDGDGKGFGANVRFLCMSVEDDALAARVKDILDEVDVVLSDVSPNLSGIWSLDHAKQIYMSRRVLDVAKVLLKDDGSAVLKVFDGDMLKEFIDEVKMYFKKVYIHKPKASRKESSELYLVCKGFKSSK